MTRSPENRPTVYDVASAAGVSIATVSRYFSAPEKVAESTRTRIGACIERLGYVQNSAARRLAGGRTNSLALCLPDFGGEDDELDLTESTGAAGVLDHPDDTSDSDLYYSELLRGVEIESRRHGLAITVLIDRDDALDERLGKLNGQAEGMVVVAPALSASALEKWAAQIPVVQIASRGDTTSIDAVQSDNAAGQAAVTGHLLDVHGVREPVFVGGPLDSPDSAARFAGYCRALADRGLPVPDEPQWRGDFTRTNGRATGRRLLETGRPEAVVCANDETALGVLDAAREAGLDLPGALPVTGFDDVPAARWSDPGLTTVRQPTSRLGRAAVTLLLRRMDDAELAPQSLTLPVDLVVRTSCGCA